LTAVKAVPANETKALVEPAKNKTLAVVKAEPAKNSSK
jgi:hypothetical protein